MPNDISSILQPSSMQHKVKESVNNRQAQTASPQEVVKPKAVLGDRISLTESARKLQLEDSRQADVKPAKTNPRSQFPLASTAYQQNDNGLSDKSMYTTADVRQFANEAAMAFNSSSQVAATTVPAVVDEPSTKGDAQRPSPAMANMMQAFLSTAGMDSFDASSDLNADGVINFHDLAALRDKESGVGTQPIEDPVEQLQSLTNAFLSAEGSDGFDVASDYNQDGMINFQDLAVLRSKMENSLENDEGPLTASD